MAEMQQAPRRDWRRGWLGPFLVFLAMLLLTLWWLGVFNSPTVTEEMGVARSYVYQPFQGSYREMVKTREKMAKDAPADLRSHTEITLLEREQGSGGDAEVVVRLGYLVNAGVPAPAGWQAGQWPAQHVARVRVNANLAIASWKAYGALSAWGKARGLPLRYPVLELLGPGDRYELLMPVASAVSAPVS
ncbi:MAG: hypothetical protein ACYDDP_06840 [Acidithiobacillus sp.]